MSGHRRGEEYPSGVCCIFLFLSMFLVTFKGYGRVGLKESSPFFKVIHRIYFFSTGKWIVTCNLFCEFCKMTNDFFFMVFIYSPWWFEEIISIKIETLSIDSALHKWHWLYIFTVNWNYIFIFNDIPWMLIINLFPNKMSLDQYFL